MSIDWFRSWHGAPTDPKWLLIARNAMKRSETHVTPGMVSAVVWALFDHASQAEHRGNVGGFDVETYSVFSGFSVADIEAIIGAMVDKNLIFSGALSAWEKRQPKREDNSSVRVAPSGAGTSKTCACRMRFCRTVRSTLCVKSWEM